MAAPRIRPITKEQKQKTARLGIAVGERVNLVCPACGKKFSRTYCWVLQSRTLACSHKCSAVISPNVAPYNFDRGHTDCICPVCDKPFSCENRRFRVAKTGPFCSRVCAGVAKRGKKNVAWKGGPVPYGGPAQKLMRERKKAVGRCERCGSKKRLQSHHLLPVAEYPQLAAVESNIVVLCAKCHGDEHPYVRNALERKRTYTGVKIECVVCGKLRYVMPSVFALGNAECCGKSCSMVLRARRLKFI